ncbi:hypothetical protein V8F20_003888 [Naviculisporaceae sp. PSN 640]
MSNSALGPSWKDPSCFLLFGGKEEKTVIKEVLSKLREIDEYLAFCLLNNLWSVSPDNKAFFSTAQAKLSSIRDRIHPLAWAQHSRLQSTNEEGEITMYSHIHPFGLRKEVRDAFARGIMPDGRAEFPLRRWLDRCLVEKTDVIEYLMDVYQGYDPAEGEVTWARTRSRRGGALGENFRGNLKEMDLEMFMVCLMLDKELQDSSHGELVLEDLRPWNFVEDTLLRLVRKTETDASWLVGESMKEFVSALEDGVLKEDLADFIKKFRELEEEFTPRNVLAISQKKYPFLVGDYPHGQTVHQQTFSTNLYSQVPPNRTVMDRLSAMLNSDLDDLVAGQTCVYVLEKQGLRWRPDACLGGHDGESSKRNRRRRNLKSLAEQLCDSQGFWVPGGSEIREPRASVKVPSNLHISPARACQDAGIPLGKPENALATEGLVIDIFDKPDPGTTTPNMLLDLITAGRFIGSQMPTTHGPAIREVMMIHQRPQKGAGLLSNKRGLSGGVVASLKGLSKGSGSSSESRWAGRVLGGMLCTWGVHDRIGRPANNTLRVFALAPKASLNPDTEPFDTHIGNCPAFSCKFIPQYDMPPARRNASAWRSPDYAQPDGLVQKADVRYPSFGSTNYAGEGVMGRCGGGLQCLDQQRRCTPLSFANQPPGGLDTNGASWTNIKASDCPLEPEFLERRKGWRTGDWRTAWSPSVGSSSGRRKPIVAAGTILSAVSHGGRITSRTGVLSVVHLYEYTVVRVSVVQLHIVSGCDPPGGHIARSWTLLGWPQQKGIWMSFLGLDGGKSSSGRRAGRRAASPGDLTTKADSTVRGCVVAAPSEGATKAYNTLKGLRCCSTFRGGYQSLQYSQGLRRCSTFRKGKIVDADQRHQRSIAISMRIPVSSTGHPILLGVRRAEQREYLRHRREAMAADVEAVYHKGEP